MALPTDPQPRSHLTVVLIAIVVLAMLLITLLTVTAILHGPPAV